MVNLLPWMSPRFTPMSNVVPSSGHSTRSRRGHNRPNRYLGKTPAYRTQNGAKKPGVDVFLLDGMRFYGEEAERWAKERGISLMGLTR